MEKAEGSRQEEARTTDESRVYQETLTDLIYSEAVEVFRAEGKPSSAKLLQDKTHRYYQKKYISNKAVKHNLLLLDVS